MNISKVFIRNIEIPIKNGTLGLVKHGDVSTIEVELEVHPTIVSFIETFGFAKEKVTIHFKDHTEIIGEFNIHSRISSILLTSNIKEIEGVDDLSLLPHKKKSILIHSVEGISIDKEFKTKQKSMLISFLTSLLEIEIDEENRIFIKTLLEKIIKEESLNSFDRYIKDEIYYNLEDAMAQKK
ncbi:hypothetical protein BIV60_25630 [Bacillus sp. MUM 116]|uniref:hypothetical protein n=1 Tax=Bacillus sp. MUM 116 TaxID=1678002 RepID=UPI0008F5D9FE|nr:hypothetical protein [Bacillus sp. MUM 116]OIK08661.1 hypothetical protein BIV60_25630 [Bacillus sp. MUM 116]